MSAASPRLKRWWRVASFAVLYAALGQLVRFLPNPMVPGAIIALNMIIPILGGYFYGPRSGALIGVLGTLSNWLFKWWVLGEYDAYEPAGLISLSVAGALAGWCARWRSGLLVALTIVPAHAINLALFAATDLLSLKQVVESVFGIGLLAETMIDIVAVLLSVTWGKRYLYDEQRW